MDLKEIFEPGGLIAGQLESYEYRPQQLEMATATAQALDESAHLVIEAGTGVGKSFAYLIPAIDFAISASERVVVSTNTISLQEQLINKDIPFLQEILPDSFKVVLVKGRSNYLCMRRLEGLMLYERGLFESKDEVDDLSRITQWARLTRDGSLADLEPQPGAQHAHDRSSLAPLLGTAQGRRRQGLQRVRRLARQRDPRRRQYHQHSLLHRCRRRLRLARPFRRRLGPGQRVVARHRGPQRRVGLQRRVS